MKERGETEADSDSEKTPLKLAKASSSTHNSSSNLSANSTLLNLQIIKPPSLPSSLFTTTTATSSGALSNHNNPSFTFAALPGDKSFLSFLKDQIHSHSTIQLKFHN